MQVPYKLSVFLNKLAQAGGGPFRREGEEFRGRCPAHADNGPSLYVRAKGGKILINCKGGCTTLAVCEAADHATADSGSDRTSARGDIFIQKREQHMNKKKSDETTIGYWFGIAREQGIASPVLLMFDPAPQAAAVYARLSGRSYRSTGISRVEPEVLTHTTAETAKALRDSAGLGGRLMANLLETPPAGVARWLLSLSGDGIGAIAFVGENSGYQAHAFYDELPPIELCDRRAGKEGPVPLVVTVDATDNGDGEIDLFLRVADVSQAGDAMTLARVVANRRIPSVGHSPGFM